MLILTRKPGQSIVAGDIVIHIGKLRCGRVSLAIDAPIGVSILRGELIQPSDADPDLASKPTEWLHSAVAPTRKAALMEQGALR